MAELHRALDPCSNIERLLKDERYQEAKSQLAQRLKRNPRDREASLYLLLVNVTLHGLRSYEKEVERLRSVSDFSDSEKEIVRRLFLIAFTSAEKKGEEKQAWLYQRLLRRLLINQPLDQAPLQINPTSDRDQPMIRKQI